MARPKAPFRLIFNNDSTNTAGCISPWHGKDEPFREEHLVASIDELAGTGVDAHLLAPGLGWVPWWQSKVAADHYQWWMKSTGLTPDALHGQYRYTYEGGDMVRVLIDRCRKQGIAPMATFRVNDVHGQEHAGEKTPASAGVCRFYTENPQWWLDPKQKEKRGYYSLRGMDWAVPEVRQYKLSLIRELCENYDLAGLELDFLRDNHIFHVDRTSLAQRVAIITEFAAQVRAALDARKVPGVPRRWLSVRIPSASTAWGEIGLDLAELWKAGVDMFNLSTWYHSPSRTAVAEARRIVPDAALYVELTHCTGNHWEYEVVPTRGLRSAIYDATVIHNPRCSDAELCTAAHLALSNGADGISLFNFVYYRQHAPLADVPITEPPFHVLPMLRDRQRLAGLPQHYTLAKTSYSAQVPKTLQAGEAVTLQFDLALGHRRAEGYVASWAARTWTDEGQGANSAPISRLRLHFRAPLTDQSLAVQINGHPATPSDDVARLYGNPFDGMISRYENRRSFTIPRSLLKDGENRIDVSFPTGQPLELIYADLGVA